MNETERQNYLQRYQEAKKKGLPFYPDVIFKDAVIALIVFLILIGLAYFIGVPLEPRADPADTNYTPRPEWYFLFLFQLLKYFPGNLEVLGVVVIPTIVVLLLFLLPLIDRNLKKNILNRPVILGATIIGLLAVVFLSVQSILEAPPPSVAAAGDPVAQLYATNCAGCHGPSITIATDVNLHEVIAQGKHEGMPAWNADLSTDEIDALAGFIQSPKGSTLFMDNCSACHEISELVSGNPIQLKDSLEQDVNFIPHSDIEIPEWSSSLSQQDRTELLNFIVAPDGQRLYTINCSPCHGRAIEFSGDEAELEATIRQGGNHLEMPTWRERLSPSELDRVTFYVFDPETYPAGKELYDKYCIQCHGERIPQADEFYAARRTIAEGGAHQTMPVWGEALTEEQLIALVSYTYNLAKGTPLEEGQELFTANCASCHGAFGEGGLNPSRPDDIIAPISTSEYLNTRDDASLRSIIAQGQPNFGMSPFGSSYGGPLDDDQIDAIVAFIRAWQSNPPVEVPPEVKAAYEGVPLSGREFYDELCAQCHGLDGEGGIGPSLSDAGFQVENTDQQIFDTINLGHEATPMIAWGEILTSGQIQQLVELIRGFDSSQTSSQETGSAITFEQDIKPILEKNCSACHGSLGGWDASTYEAVMETGENAPVVIPGDAENSLLIQKLMGTHTDGTIMPPGGKLPDALIQIVIDWVDAGALE